MKLATLLLSFALFQHVPPSLLLLDTTYRTKPAKTVDFAWGMYTNKQFPIYAEDKKAIIEGAQKLARLINNGPPCTTWETVSANNSCFILTVQCQDYTTYTVRFQTKVTEMNLTCNIELSRRETDAKKVQRSLIELASYLEQDQ